MGQGGSEVVRTIVGAFNHSDAICSTLFFTLTVDIFPSETGRVCMRFCVVCVCVRGKKKKK